MNLYLIQNDITKRFYIGITKDVQKRLKEHNNPNNHYTGKQKGEWKLLGIKCFKATLDARKEEIRLKKSKNKKYILWYFTVDERVRSSTGRAAPS